VVSNVEQTTYLKLRNLRKKYTNLPKDNFTASDRADSEEIKHLLAKLGETHPELCFKEKFMQSKSFKNETLSKESTFDRPNMTNDPEMSRNFFKNPPVSVSRPPAAKGLKRPAAAKNPKKVTVKKAKIKAEWSQEIEEAIQFEHNMSGTPVDFMPKDDKEMKEMIRQFIDWGAELRVELHNLNGTSIKVNEPQSLTEILFKKITRKNQQPEN
jgi:hypothetical protein